MYTRGYLREFGASTIVDECDRRGVDASSRTIRRVLEAMVATDVLEDVGEDRRRLYRLGNDVAPSSDMSQSRRRNNDISDDGGLERAPTSPNSVLEDDDLLILHLFADQGVESEPLSAYGRVVRIGIDPQRTAFSDALKADALRPPVVDEFDLAVAHPPCQRWSTATYATGDPDEHPDHLEETQAIVDELADEWIIENVPEAPLNDPVLLDGRMFGLPVVYRRAFETSFPIPQPRQHAELLDRSGPFADEDGGLGDWRGDRLLWRSAKQVAGDYPADELKRSGIPAPYIHYLARYWLRSALSEESQGAAKSVKGATSERQQTKNAPQSITDP